MKRVLLLLMLASPAWASWTVVQHVTTVATCVAASSTCAITVASTGTGNVISIGMAIQSNVEAIVSVSGGGTYIHPGTCNAVQGTTRATDCAYTLASTSGTTSITVTRTDATSHVWSCAATEYSFTNGPVSVDVINTATVTSAVANPAGVSLTLSGANDAIFQEGYYTTSITAVSSPYSTNANFPTAGYASSINTASGTAPTWTATSGTGAFSAIAFKEKSPCAHMLALLGAGCS